MEIPQELTEFKEQIESTSVEFVKIKINDKPNISLLTSRFGGMPYLVNPNAYPKDPNGKDLILLAQINFSEVPKLAGFPEDGILQFFISDNDVYGMDFYDQTKQGLFKLIYFHGGELNEKSAIQNYNWPVPEKYFVLNGTFGLSFEKSQAPMTPIDFRFKKITGDSLWDQNKEAFNTCWTLSQAEGHKIGGYPNFTQDDPRFDSRYQEYTTLLLQIDSDSSLSDKGYEIIWGDAGVANFFIKPEDLKDLNFTDVLYNWDCY